MPHSLPVWQHLANRFDIGIGNLPHYAELPLPLRTLLRQDMTQVGLSPLETTLTGAAKPFGGSAITFHLWHS
jgi:hypothetical protein